MPQPTRSNRIPARPSPSRQSSQPLLAKLPRRTMTAQEQLAALAQVQQQAEQRVKLGQQLFNAAEQRLSGQSQVLQQVRAEQDKLREQVQDDVAKSLQSYDQWMGQIDEGFTRAIAQLGDRLDQVEQSLAGSRGEMETMLSHAAELLEQTQQLLEKAFDDEPAGSTGSMADNHPPSVAPTPDAEPDDETGAPPPLSARGSEVFGRLLDELEGGGPSA